MTRATAPLLALLLSTAACDNAPAPSGATTASAAPTAPAAASSPAPRPVDTGTAKIGIPCKHMSDCGSAPGCDMKCNTLYDSHGKETEAYCMATGGAAKVGVTGCIGHRRGTVTTWGPGKKIERGVFCDVLSGAYCDYATNVCVKTKALGDACANVYECGRDADCSDGKCVAGIAVGASCKDVRCNNSAYCDDAKKCVARKALGTACRNSDQCETDVCLNTHCGPAEPRSECGLL